MTKVFVYGTLMCNEILEKLTGKVFKYQPAVLPGFRIFVVQDSNYPAIMGQDDDQVKGMLIENVDEKSLEILSFYEGTEYTLKKVTVFANQQIVEALVFVWAGSKSLLEDKKWDLQYFRDNSLKYYYDVVVPESLYEFWSKKNIEF